MGLIKRFIEFALFRILWYTIIIIVLILGILYVKGRYGL